MRLRFVALAVLLVSIVVVLPRPTAAREVCFPEQSGVTACLAEPFVRYWEANGGLPVFGYPISEAAVAPQQESNADLLTQWTERARLESHPANSAPYTILMGRLGAERLQQLGRDPAREGRESGPLEGCLWFEQTGHNVCDQAPGMGFQTYWQTHGLNISDLSAYEQSLQLFGLPLTTAQIETNGSGATVLTQWFERARFEWHPDNPKEYRVLLGLLGREVVSGARAQSLFGVQIGPGLVGATVSKAVDAGLPWVRYDAFHWSAVEPAPGARDWQKLGLAETELRVLADQGLTTIVGVHGAPAWAQQIPGAACGPIKAEALDAYAAFMRELVARYSQPPYRVRYWEIWNEPDAPSTVGGDSPFGCWGDPNDPYYGGGYFAEMLKRVYPAIKQADPAAKVVLGGLLLDCDPDHPPAGKDCRSARFFEGVLRNGGGAAFDILAYHGYAYWSPTKFDWELAQSNWAVSGGAVLGKLAFLRAVLSRYNTSKPIMLTEAALLCVDKCPLDQYDTDQANYIVRLYTRAHAHGLMGAVWYTLNGPGWRNTGLLDRAQQPRLGYQAYTFLARLLNGAQYTGSFSSGALEGYSFRKGATVYQICWTNDGSTISLTLPQAISTTYDKLGQQLAMKGPSLNIGFEPVVIESKP